MKLTVTVKVYCRPPNLSLTSCRVMLPLLRMLASEKSRSVLLRVVSPTLKKPSTSNSQATVSFDWVN